MKRLLIVLISTLFATTLQAQAPYSAVLRIMNPGVELRRIHTEA